MTERTTRNKSYLKAGATSMSQPKNTRQFLFSGYTFEQEQEFAELREQLSKMNRQERQLRASMIDSGD